MDLHRTPEQPRSATRPSWRDLTFAQGRTLSWLAGQTGKSTRTIYAYSRGVLKPSEEWLTTVGQLLGEEVDHVAQIEAAV